MIYKERWRGLGLRRSWALNGKKEAEEKSEGDCCSVPMEQRTWKKRMSEIVKFRVFLHLWNLERHYCSLLLTWKTNSLEYSAPIFFPLRNHSPCTGRGRYKRSST